MLNNYHFAILTCTGPFVCICVQDDRYLVHVIFKKYPKVGAKYRIKK